MLVKSVVLLAGMVAVVACVFCAGCENTETGMTLTVTPATSVINTNGVVLLKAGLPENTSSNETRQIYFPLSWSVSNSKIGFLRDMAGDSAVYEGRNAKGVNTVTVRDQAGAEGIAVITQEEELEAAPELVPEVL